MKGIFVKACTFMSIMLLTTSCATAQLSGLGNILGSMGGDSSSSSSTTTTTTKDDTSSSSSSSTGLGGLLNALGGGSSSSSSSSSALGSALGSILGDVLNLNSELTVADLQGTWKYSAPACKFQSENFLKSAGGSVVASQISGKLAPYYEKIGITSSKFSFTFDAEGSFTMNYGKLPLSGSATKSQKSGYFQLEFIKLGTYALASTPAYIEVQGNTMVMCFDAEKLVKLFSSLVGGLGNSTLSSITSLIESYDGVLIGFEFTRVN